MPRAFATAPLEPPSCPPFRPDEWHSHARHEGIHGVGDGGFGWFDHVTMADDGLLEADAPAGEGWNEWSALLRGHQLAIE